MSPIKSSLAKTAKQLLGLRNTADLGLRGASQKSKKVFTMSHVICSYCSKLPRKVGFKCRRHFGIGDRNI